MKFAILTGLLALGFNSASAEPVREFTADPAATRAEFHQFCDFVISRPVCGKIVLGIPGAMPGGYYQRTLVAGYRVFGKRRYLDAALAYGDALLAAQTPQGYWTPPGGDPLLGDVGSTLGLLIDLEPLADPARRGRYLDCIRRYDAALAAEGLVYPSGAIGSGNRRKRSGGGIPIDEYTISTAFNGVKLPAWLYQQTHDERYAERARRSIHWLLDPMRADGVIPYVHTAIGVDLSKPRTPANEFALWEKSRYQVSAYVGEAVIAFDRYCPRWRSEVQGKMGPQVEFLLRTQNPSGSWGFTDAEDARRSFDQKRSPGLVNFLIWYHDTVAPDARIAAAVRRFERFLRDPQRAAAFGLLTTLPGPAPEKFGPNDVITALSGRVMAGILLPGLD